MTGGWAATSTLRELREEAERGRETTRDARAWKRYDRDAHHLALVETALDAFEEWGYQRRRFIDGETEIVTLRDAEANALAALRVVREGR